MRLEKASYKAIVYACKNFHYSKSVPINSVGYSVFNDKKEWCGVIIYGRGANPNLPKSVGLKQGQAIELVRVALNGKQESTSKAVSISLKLFKKDNPLVEIVISFADQNQNHYGVIYQACNWFFTGIGKSTPQWNVNGKKVHQRQVASLGFKIRDASKLFTKEKILDKYRYEFPFTKEMIEFCKKRMLPYPKKETSAGSVKAAQQSSRLQEGFESTPALN